jgi:hypothetical protein
MYVAIFTCAEKINFNEKLNTNKLYCVYPSYRSRLESAVTNIAHEDEMSADESFIIMQIVVLEHLLICGDVARISCWSGLC